ncbi:hypothetical protein AKJ37_00295 [candidate division MSBL1 archaeon SCGC-AAA259I09]|uniref:Phosphomevalonate dehydratase large subunit n=1 Tax=candidate division MSBL1 archaeon SCGC-AAA259I09 TaxID=1698267 RepID=A0A133UVW7_9EURY|nr:hypothetical protein AKJ37_00295 [candidate division MSBL1 archaeon SCGC-AAA259I09]
MYLNKEQERMLSGEESEAVQNAMEILVGLGDIYDAKRLIPIESAHISGISMRTSGEAGLSFIEDMVDKGARTSVPTTINPAGMDLKNWKEMGAPAEMSEKQIRMVDAYEKIGAEPTCSCVPYFIGNNPSFGEHVSWAESSAIVYANSILGARTNREGAPSALASSITGLTPEFGYHLKENRAGSLTIIPDLELFEGRSTFPYSVLGYWIGENFPESVPVIRKIRPTYDQHKALGAGMAASGAIALYHIPSVTAEAKKNPEICETGETVSFGVDEYEKTVDELDQTSDCDLICIGCPHASIDELRFIAEKIDDEKEIWVCLPRRTRNKEKYGEVFSDLEKRGLKLVCDTCMVVAPLSEMGYSSIGVNSTKAAHYAPSLADVKVHLAPIEELVK